MLSVWRTRTKERAEQVKYRGLCDMVRNRLTGIVGSTGGLSFLLLSLWLPAAARCRFGCRVSGGAQTPNGRAQSHFTKPMRDTAVVTGISSM
jgi:hypothetical protein